MRQFFCISLILFTETLYSQTIDEIRLGFEKTQVISNQLGITVNDRGDKIAIYYDDGTLNIFDITIGKIRLTHQLIKLDLFEIRFAGPNKLLLVDIEGKVLVFDISLKKTAIEFDISSYSASKDRLPSKISRMDISLIQPYVAFGHNNGNVSIWNYNTGKFVKLLPFEAAHPSMLQFHPTEHVLVIGHLYFKKFLTAAGSVDSGIKYYDTKNWLSINDQFNDPLKTFQNKGKYANSYNPVVQFFSGGNFSPSGDELLINGSQPTRPYFINIDFKTGQVIYRRKIPYQGSSGGYYTSSIPIDNKILSFSGTNSFEVFNIYNESLIFTTRSEKSRLSAYVTSNLDRTVGIDQKRIYQLSNPDLFLVNQFDHNVNFIYSLKENRILAYLYTDSNRDFTVITRDGKMDGTPEALEKLFWTSRKSNKKTYLESAFEKGYTPNLLAQLVAGSIQDMATFEIDDIIDYLPVIKISSYNTISVNNVNNTIPKISTSQKNGVIVLEVTENIEQISQLKLFHNRKLVKIIENPMSPQIEFNVSLSASLGGINSFSILATSKNSIDSEKQKLIVNYNGSTSESPRLFLLTIGIDAYRNPRHNLNYAVADANGFREALKVGSSSLFEDIFFYDIRDSLATKNNILSTLQKIQMEALEEDLLIFYFAGHGVMSQGITSESMYFLVPHDVTQLFGRDEMLYEKAISADELREISMKINAQKQVFVIDACQSAGALSAMTRRGADEERAIAQLARSTGTFWITSTGSEQYATEFEALGHGVFTYALLEGLNGEADGNNQDGKITLRELISFTENRVPELSEKHKGKLQFPASYSFGNDFPIVIYRD